MDGFGMRLQWFACFLCTVTFGTYGRDAYRKPTNFPDFLDYDCALASTRPGSVADWNQVYELVQSASAAPKPQISDVSFPKGLEYLILPTEKMRLQRIPERASAECPLGFLYLLLLHFYDEFSKDRLNVQVERQIQVLLTTYPTYALALTRWPITQVLAHFSQFFQTEDDDVLCKGVKGVTDWDQCRKTAVRFMEVKYMDEGTPGRDELGNALQDDLMVCSSDMLASIETLQKAANECPFGYLFFVALEMLMAAGRFTEDLPVYGHNLDLALKERPFQIVTISPWPLWHVLAIFADMNKGMRHFSGDRKYMRGYSDWNLRSDELSPLVSPGNAFLSAEWKEEAARKIERLVHLDHGSYVDTLHTELRRQEDGWGYLRPIVRSLVDAAQAVAAASESRGLERKLAYVVLLYGGTWAYLLERLVRHLAQLQVAYPLLVIAIGDDAASACRKLASAEASTADVQVICWMPDTMSQVHRFTCIHGLLHLGIDVLYTDMDTFWLRDPTHRILSSASDWDALFARHGDADCINIGVFHLRASANTVLWMSQFMAWYHDHPFEIDQRGLHIFLRLPAEKMKISYYPKDLVQIRGSVLNDTNEVVIGRVGWHGALSRMLIFHWCHEPIELKEGELNAAFDASESLASHNLPISLALLVVSSANAETAWAPVLRMRRILEAYETKQPINRTPCW